MAFLQKDSYDVADLLEVMELLRKQCPWDKEQTHKSIRKNFIEETCEAVEAIDLDDAVLLKEELGDVLLQVVFHSQIEKESGGFNFGDVCDGICKKLVYRHPHIFADALAGTPEEVLKNWDDLKKKEKGQESVTQTLRAVPKTFPATMRCEKVQKRAAKSGFDYPDTQWAMRDLKSELEELEEAIGSGDSAAVKEELGDLIFSAVNVSRFVKADAEEALGESCDKFIARFEQVENLAAKRGIDMSAAGIHLLDELWREVKKENNKNLEVF